MEGHRWLAEGRCPNGCPAICDRLIAQESNGDAMAQPESLVAAFARQPERQPEVCGGDGVGLTGPKYVDTLLCGGRRQWRKRIATPPMPEGANLRGRLGRFIRRRRHVLPPALAAPEALEQAIEREHIIYLEEVGEAEVDATSHDHSRE